ncbi:MAG: RtcB family protein [Acidobacteria bacterium]|nr:RtcB family protein [Acidobacteriota bacterium]MBI3655054.1 RtcB family protein [Acidobacteriota bacterium]
MEIKKLTDYLWEIPQSGGMRVPGRIYASADLLREGKLDESLNQVKNVAHLPGILKYSLAMPDIHWGYGFPIGGIAAIDASAGVISPGGVGYDINCGVRLVRSNLVIEDAMPRLRSLVTHLFKRIPAGVGSEGAIRKLKREEVSAVVAKGARWAIEQGYGSATDLEYMEEYGCLPGADPDAISDRAYARGAHQVGTLGSGNHFLEIDAVAEIFDEPAAGAFGLFQDQICVMIHSGSRGFGYQICDDYLHVMEKAMRNYDLHLPDRQLACAPLGSPEATAYFGAMYGAANFAWANRQVMMHLAEQAFLESLAISPAQLGFRLVYDVCHNIGKFEEHVIDGQPRRVCMHRKGATRAFAPGHPLVPPAYRSVGQPVIIPGDMGTNSYVLVGTAAAMEQTFGSSCHGAGRVMSRHQALKEAGGRDLCGEMAERGIIVMSTGKRTLAEERPEAYKDVTRVVDVMHHAGVSRKVAKLRPLGVVKG